MLGCSHSGRLSRVRNQFKKKADACIQKGSVPRPALRPKSFEALAMCVRIVLECKKGLSSGAVVNQLPTGATSVNGT